MEKIKLAIHLEDQEYAAALSRALASCCDSFDILLPDTRQGADPSPSDPDLLLLSENVLVRPVPPNVVILNDDPCATREGVVSILRFQPIGRIAAGLLALARQQGRSARSLALSAEDCRFLCFTSPFGGCGLSACALLCGQALSRLYRRRVLYVSLEGCCKQGDEWISAPDLRRTVALLLEGQLPPQEFFPADEYGLLHFSCGGLNPLAGLPAEDLAHVLEGLARSSGADTVILDLPVQPSCVRIASLCEDRILVRGFRPASDALLSQYATLLDCNAQIALPEDADAFAAAEQGGTADLHSRLGAEVRAFAQSLEERR